MVIGEYTKYGLVLISTVTGSVAGHLYTNKAKNLRMWLERKGNRLLRSSDPIWMYERMVKRNKEAIKELLKKNVSTDSSSSENDKTNEELAFELMNWCQEALSDRKWNLEKQVTDYCDYPYK